MLSVVDPADRVACSLHSHRPGAPVCTRPAASNCVYSSIFGLEAGERLRPSRKREGREAILSSSALPTPRSRSSTARALEPSPSPSSAICLPWSRSRSNSNRSRSALIGGASRSLRVSSRYQGTPTKRAAKGQKEPTHAQRALEILQDLCASDGLTGFAGTPPNFSTVPAEWWRDRFYQRAMPGEDQDTKKHAFARASKTLIGQHKAGMANNRVWIVTRDTQK